MIIRRVSRSFSYPVAPREAPTAAGAVRETSPSPAPRPAANEEGVHYGR
jgi:hypothetical protein